MAIVMMATTTLTAVTMAVTAVDLTLIPLTAQPANVLNQLAFKIRILFSKFNQNQSTIRCGTYAILGVQIVHSKITECHLFYTFMISSTYIYPITVAHSE